MSTPDRTRLGDPERMAVLVAVVAVVVLLIYTAWACDDAYITFRSADNLVHGYGLRWNIDERVQSFTNPLWLLVFTSVYTLSGNAFYTAIFLGLALSAAALVVFVREVARTPQLALAGLLLLALSKAFVEFSTSGLENPLTHLLLFLFIAYWVRAPRDPGGVFRISLVAALLLLDRLDMLWLVLPPLLALIVPLCRQHGIRRFRDNGLRSLLLGMLPIIAWLLFATFYFGFPVPNTAYAKAAGGIPLVFRLRAGVYYLLNSLSIDPVTLGVVAMAVIAALTVRSSTTWPLAVGLVLYLAYVVWVGGDFMSGRFLSAPFVVGVALLAFALPVDRLPAQALGVAGIGLAWLGGFPTLDPGGKSRIFDYNGIVDARRESAGLRLLDGSRFHRLPDARWATEGRKLAAGPARVIVRGGVGLLGYFAGPRIHIIDVYGLTDPLLAHLPVPDAEHELAFRAGHLRRNIPEGYVASRRGTGQIEDPGVRHYEDEIALVTRGSLWSWRRLVAIARLDSGLDRHQLASWIAWSNIKRIKLGVLDRAGSKDRRKSYTYWSRASKRGVLFTDTGVRVSLPSLSHVATWKAELGPGRFAVIPMLGRKRLRGARSAGGPGVSARQIALPAAAVRAGYDALLFVRIGAHTGYDELWHLRPD